MSLSGDPKNSPAAHRFPINNPAVLRLGPTKACAVFEIARRSGILPRFLHPRVIYRAWKALLRIPAIGRAVVHGVAVRAAAALTDLADTD